MTAFDKASFSLRWLHRYAVLTAVCTFVLVFAGGLVKSKGASLSVPDWPTSYGGFNPPGWLYIENVRAEHGHRLIAGTVALMTLGLAIWIQRRESRRWVRLTAWAAFGAVIVQALLGGLTVLFYLPDPISISHGMLGQTFFCMTVALALFTSPAWRRPRAEPIRERGGLPLPRLAAIVTALIFFQLFLGALMRHTESGLAITDFPLAYGRLIPPTDAESLEIINRERFFNHLPDATPAQIVIHFVHRVGALAVAAGILWLGFRVLRRFRAEGSLAIPAAFLLALLPLQILLGALTVWSGKQPHITTAHVAIGALTLAVAVALTLQAFRRVEPVKNAAEDAARTKPLDSREAAT